MLNLFDSPFPAMVLAVMGALIFAWTYAKTIRPEPSCSQSGTRAVWMVTTINGGLLFSIIALLFIEGMARISGGY